MTRTSWRTAAGALGLAICGIVVYAQDHCRQLADHTPMPNDTSTPILPPIHGELCAYPMPVEPPAIIETVPTPVVMFEPTPVVSEMPEPIAPTCPLLPPSGACEMPPAPRTITQPSIRTAVALSQVAPPIGVAIPYKVRMENSGGVTRLEIVRGEDVALRMLCDRIDVQMPGGGLSATGKVTLTAPGIEVQCHRVTIAWQNGDMTMEGQVRVQCQNGANTTEMVAESINCRLNSLGAGLSINARLMQSETPPAHPSNIKADPFTE